MSLIGRLSPVALALLVATVSPSSAQDSTQVAARGDAADGVPVRLLCTPKSLGMVCSATNVRAAVSAGVGGRSQTLTIAPYQPFATPRGRTLHGFDVTVTGLCQPQRRRPRCWSPMSAAMRAASTCRTG